MDSCLFCKIVKGEIPCQKIGENEEFLCFLDNKPVNEGHALIIPKRHFKDITDFPDDLDKGYFAFVKEIVSKILPAVGADGFNIGMNNGAAAGQVIFHQHTHLIPRFKDDKKKSWESKDVSTKELLETQKKILKQNK